ncbi:SAC3 [[Candida] subhashii]|uniref:Nuclear mRNA export factor n=1 Tax=[Candida] subhashii TaxID=561895 RepID=A0A8J5USP3_9ASCO|nr:SAC3 [[Candida] subhashii]KAG7665342.1 SAC3 [[Candida] subhashii]
MSAFASSAFNVPNGMANNNRKQQFNSSNINNNNINENTYSNPRRSGTRKTFNKPNGLATSNSNGKPEQRSKNVSKRFNTNNDDSSASSFVDPLDRPTKVIPRKNPGKLQSYTQEQIDLIGPLFPSPEQFGFQNTGKVIKPRPIPKYLLPQARLLYTPPFQQNQWDKENQEKMAQMEAANAGRDYQGLYEQFQKLRDIERKKMEELGLVDAENIAKDLNDAITFQGSCLDMCPVFERVRRQLENNVKALEKDPVTNKISKERAIKAFSRPAAGQPPPLPSEVRPPHILKYTLDFLVENILGQLPEAHSFIWDRTRSIRQDFTYQNSFGPEAIDCNERIVRIHLLSLHIMAGSEIEYSQQQELEQFNKALQTLMEIYQDVRNNGGKCPNEAEFRAYHLLSHLRDPELEREIQNLPNVIFQDPKVQLALKLRSIISQNNIVERGFINTVGALNLFVEFFRIVYSEETPFLMACLLETHFNEIRFYALKSMARSYHTKGRPYAAESLAEILGFDSIEKLIKFVKYYEIDIINEHGVLYVDLFNKEKLESVYKLNSYNEKPKLSPPYSTQLDVKIQGQTLKSFVNSGLPNISLNLRDQPKIITQEMIEKTIKQPIRAFVQPTKPPTATGIFNQQQNIKPQPVFSSLTSAGQGIKPNTISFGTSMPTSKPSLQPTQIKFGTKPVETPTFGFQPPAATTIANNIPQQTNKAMFATPPTTTSATFPTGGSSFGKPAQISSVPKFGSQQANIPKIDFSFSKPPEAVAAPPKPTLEIKSTIPSFAPPPVGIKPSEVAKPIIPSFAPPPQPTKLVFKPKENVTVVPTIKVQAPTPVPKYLSDSPYFNQAIKETFSEILQDTINTELRIVLSKTIRNHSIQTERSRIIQALSGELYDAFLSEVIYETTMTAKAVAFDELRLKKKVIGQLKNCASKLIKKRKQKKQTLDELSSVSFSNKLKRRHSINNNSSNESNISNISISKRRHVDAETSFMAIEERQQQIQQLWAPIDLKHFLSICATHDLKKNNDDEVIDLKFLLVVENWNSVYSKWLNSKLQLKPNLKEMIYENHINNMKINLNLTSLPSKDYLNKDFFSDAAFVLFECGLTMMKEENGGGEGSQSIEKKLTRDKGILKKIVSLADKYGYYKVHVLILFWDISESGISSEQVSELLDLKSYITCTNLKNLILCDMTLKDGNTGSVISRAFDKISRDFDGELTPRGLKKMAKSSQLITTKATEESTPVESGTENTTVLEQYESKLLSKAKKLRKYEYLNKHMNAVSQPRRQHNPHHQANTSFNNNNTSAIISAHNKSLLPYLATRNRTMNHTNNSTFLNFNNTTTTMNNNTIGNETSILRGFGQGMIAESTPSGSPTNRSRVVDRVGKPSLTTSLSQLRELTAGVKKKYPNKK